MIGNLRERWIYTWVDIWEPLGSLPQAPRDLYMQLYRTGTDFMRHRPRYQDWEIIVNSPEMALGAFQSIKFRDEMSSVLFIESVHALIETSYSRILLRRYDEYIAKFLIKYNLRYEVAEPFTLRVRLPALYGDIYEQLRQFNTANPHLAGLMNDFEVSFSDFIRSRAQRDFRVSLARASNYAEGMAAVSLNLPGGTLGALCNQLQVWPHNDVREVVKKLYGFCSDYPGIRHAGTPNNRIRDLEVKDTIIVSAMLFAASGYLHQQVRLDDVVG